MSKFTNKFRAERGQSLVLTLLFMTVLIGMAAAVVDVGGWYRADRKLQANADAAALAGAQELPESPSEAMSTALAYADDNDGGLVAENVKFSGKYVANDTIEVVTERDAPGFLSRLFGFHSARVRARAVARTGTLARAKWAAPIAIDWKHDKLQCGRPCWGSETEPGDMTTIDFYKTGPGAFRLINIDGSHGGTGPSTLGEWMEEGLDAWMDKDRWYYSDPGMKPNSSHIKHALDIRDETEMLFPVYNATRAQGAGFEYFVIGWAIFHVTDHDIRGSSDAKVHGYFVDMVWAGIQGSTASGNHFGARAVQLVE